MSKPHICFISESKAMYGLLINGESSTTVGGAEVQQALLAPALQKLGYKVTFLVPDLGQPDEVMTQQGITLIKTREQYKGGGLKQNFQDTRLLFKAMDDAGADIYYQRTSTAITGIVALYCKLKRKPFVYSTASNMDLDGAARQRLKRHHHMLYWYGLTRADAVVVQTDDQMRLLKEKTGKDGILIRSTFSEPREAEQDAGREYVLWVGSFRKVRRPELFIDLAARLPQYDFVMVGGPWATEDILFTEMCEKAKNVRNLQMTGPIPYNEVGRYFSRAKVFVNTSFVEGFPNTYLQAWCRGVPVVATFDADDLIKRYRLGRFCTDPEGVERAVDELMRDDALRVSIGEDALRYVHENHSLDAIAARYDELFMRLVNGRPARKG